MMQEYSKRLGYLLPEQFQAALARLDLGNFVKAEPVPFGLFGQNVFLTSTQGQFVFRGMPHYPWQFPTEQFFVNQLHERTRAPMPRPYLLEPSTDIFGWSFVIMPRLPGLQLQDKALASQLSFDDRRAVARALAGMLVEVQTLTWEHAGKYDVETGHVKPFEQHYRDWVVQGIREKAEAARASNDHTTSADVAWIKGVIAWADPVLHLDYQPCAVLGDYGEHNLVVRQIEGEWRVSGVFDLMTAYFGDGPADLASQVKAYLRENEQLADEFVNEYLRLKPVYPGFVEHQKLYMLDLTLSHWEYWQRTHGSVPDEPESLSFEEWARRSVDYWDKYLA